MSADLYLDYVTESTFEQTVQLTAMCYKKKNQHTSCFETHTRISLCSLAMRILIPRFFYKNRKKREAGSIDAAILYADEQQIKLFVSILRVLYFYIPCFRSNPICPVGLSSPIILEFAFAHLHIAENSIQINLYQTLQWRRRRLSTSDSLPRSRCTKRAGWISLDNPRCRRKFEGTREIYIWKRWSLWKQYRDVRMIYLYIKIRYR